MEIIQPILNFISHWIWLPMLIIYIGVLTTILIENRNPSKTLAWLLVIILLPIIGLVLYYFFGQKFAKEKRIKKLTEAQHIRLEEELEKIRPILDANLQEIHNQIGNFSKVFRFMINEKISAPTLHNKAKILLNGEEKFEDLKIALKKAEHSIHMEYYIYEPDNIGLEILGILEERAKNGVKVRLVVDSFGAPRMVKYMKKNKNSLIEFQNFLPITFVSLADSNYRNHRKIIIIDGKIGYIGGINIADNYINSPKLKNQQFWRDTSLYIEGAAVAVLQIEFWYTWNQTKGKEFNLEANYLPSKSFENNGNASIGFVSCNPTSNGPYNLEALLIAIGEATTNIQLCTPYYVPSEELERALIMAAAAGVNVELMIPYQSDSSIVKHASRSFLKAILERGVKVYYYKKGFLHGKTVNIDRKLTFIGTTNLDVRSFYINYEITAIIADSYLCNQSTMDFERDKLDCDLLTLEAWLQKPRWKRAIDSTCRLLSPLL